MIDWLKNWWTNTQPEDYDLIRRRAVAAQQLMDSEIHRDAQQAVFDALLRDLLYADEPEQILAIHRRITALSEVRTMFEFWATRLNDERRAA